LRELIARYRRDRCESCVREAKRGDNNESAKRKRLRFPYHSYPSTYIRLKHHHPPRSRIAIEFDTAAIINQFAKARCYEYSRDFRIFDTADELAFLALERERLGAHALKSIIFSAYGNAQKDTPPQGVIHSHKSCCASVLAKRVMLHVKQKAPHDHPQWQQAGHCSLSVLQQRNPRW
jgi:hypothetical protein